MHNQEAQAKGTSRRRTQKLQARGDNMGANKTNGQSCTKLDLKRSKLESQTPISQIKWTTLTRICSMKRPKRARQTNFTDPTEHPYTNLEQKTSETRAPSRFHRSNGGPSHEFEAKHIQNSDAKQISKIERKTLTRICNKKRPKL